MYPQPIIIANACTHMLPDHVFQLYGQHSMDMFSGRSHICVIFSHVNGMLVVTGL